MRHLVRDLGLGFEWLEILGFNTESKQKGEGEKTPKNVIYVIHGWSLCIFVHITGIISEITKGCMSSLAQGRVGYDEVVQSFSRWLLPLSEKANQKKFILLPKLLWPNLRKKSFTDREKNFDFQEWRLRNCKIFDTNLPVPHMEY